MVQGAGRWIGTSRFSSTVRLAEDTPALRHVAHPQTRRCGPGGQAVVSSPKMRHAAGARRGQPDQAPQRGASCRRRCGPNKGHDLAFPHGGARRRAGCGSCRRRCEALRPRARSCGLYQQSRLQRARRRRLGGRTLAPARRPRPSTMMRVGQMEDDAHVVLDQHDRQSVLLVHPWLISWTMSWVSWSPMPAVGSSSSKRLGFQGQRHHDLGGALIAVRRAARPAGRPWRRGLACASRARRPAVSISARRRTRQPRHSAVSPAATSTGYAHVLVHGELGEDSSVI